jgi:hypothetical protein
VRSPCQVYAEREGYQPRRLSIDGPGEIRLAWGACGVRVGLACEYGEVVDARVIVDAERHHSHEGSLEVLGLSAGPHVLLVLPDEEHYAARELRVVLRDGETREIDLTLIER